MRKVAPSHATVFGALVIATTALAPVSAFAGSCPADKMGIDLRQPDTTPAKGVTDIVVTSLDIGKEPIHIAGRLFRLRRLVIQPGGVVPWHSHGDRPALIYIESGEISEYATTCSVPIVHKAGEATPESHLTAHWWKNNGDVPVVIISADLFPVKGDAHTM